MFGREIVFVDTPLKDIVHIHLTLVSNSLKLQDSIHPFEIFWGEGVVSFLEDDVVGRATLFYILWCHILKYLCIFVAILYFTVRMCNEQRTAVQQVIVNL